MKEILRTLGSTRAPLILTVGGVIVLIISLLSPDRRGPASLNLVYNGESELHGSSRRASVHLGGGKITDDAARVMSTPAKLEPVVEKVGGMDVAYMLPRPSTAATEDVSTRKQERASTQDKVDNHADADDVKGTAVLLHGCSHTHTDWFSLPEERRIVKLLLSRGYISLALKSQETCWATGDKRSLFMDSSSSNWDLEHGVAALKALLEKWQVQDKPTYVIGASSGGTFAMMLPTALPISGVVVQISPGAPSSIETWLPTDPHESSNTGPVALVYMPKDESWASKDNVEGTARVLRERGHPVLNIPCSGDVKFGPSYLSERLPEKIPPASSAMVVTELVRLGQAMCEESPLGPECRLTHDPRQLRSIATLADKGNQEVKALLKEPGMSAAVEESLNRLWGQHELTSEGAERWLAFLEEHGGKEEGGDIVGLGNSDAQ